MLSLLVRPYSELDSDLDGICQALLIKQETNPIELFGFLGYFLVSRSNKIMLSWPGGKGIRQGVYIRECCLRESSFNMTRGGGGG